MNKVCLWVFLLYLLDKNRVTSDEILTISLDQKNISWEKNTVKP